MATPTYTFIDSVTLGSSTQYVTFSNIGQSFADLVLIINGLGAPNAYPVFRGNGFTSSTHKGVNMGGSGSALTSYSSSTQSRALLTVYTGANNSNANLIKAHIMDYSATDKHKGVLVTAGQTGSSTGFGTELTFSQWPISDPLTDIEIYAFGTFAVGSTFHLYGIEK